MSEYEKEEEKTEMYMLENVVSLCCSHESIGGLQWYGWS